MKFAAIPNRGIPGTAEVASIEYKSVYQFPESTGERRLDRIRKDDDEVIGLITKSVMEVITNEER